VSRFILCGILFAVLSMLFVTSLPAQGQVFAKPYFGELDGKRKVGQYIWVWHSQRLSVSGKASVEADCPLDYVAIGGGYNTGKGVYLLFESKPNPAFNGWIVSVFAGGSGFGGTTVTVYASCAPAS
jgi:hypothetical protein